MKKELTKIDKNSFDVNPDTIHKETLTEIFPESDSDGYPTRETLQIIREYRTINKKGRNKLLKFCMEAWKYDDYVSEKDGVYQFSTAGWSGNEDIIGAMMHNQAFWIMAWESSRRGGHYEFKLN